MTRRTSVLATLLLMLAIMPGIVGAQAPDEGKGVAADPEVKASAIAFVREFVDRINQRDPVAYDMAVPGYWPGATTRDGFAEFAASIATLKLYGVGSVKIHSATGHVSVQVSYSGSLSPATYWTKRWFLQPVEGGGYLMDHSEALAPKAAGDLVAGTAELTLANSGLTLNVPTLTGTTLLILRTTNQETTQALTSGLYELPDGVTAEEVQAALMSDYSAYRYIGPTPLAPGASSPWAFLVDPGKHYLIQEFTLDQNLQNPQIMQGAGFAVTFDIG